MITTVTTTTTTAITTVAAASLALIVILTLIVLLIQKEVISGMDSATAKRLARALNIAILPLILVFASTVIVKVMEALH